MRKNKTNQRGQKGGQTGNVDIGQNNPQSDPSGSVINPPQGGRNQNQPNRDTSMDIDTGETGNRHNTNDPDDL